MLQVLSWNAYNNNTPPPMSNVSTYLPSPDSPRDPLPPTAAHSFKRKRATNGEGEHKRQASALDMSEMHRAAPAPTKSMPTGAHGISMTVLSHASEHQKPSEGLPTPLLSPTSASMDKSESEATVQASAADSSEARRSKTRQVVVQQVNLEILLKHNELRLIDQEIAKCQIALEQLRRCSEIPYPATALSESVSSGTGPALRQKYAGAPLPQSPAPWGVVDGPYSRHYASWLLPDTRFDGGEPEPLGQFGAASKRPAKGRHGRPSVVEDMIGSSSRSQRNGSLQSLPSGYAPPKEKASGPLILKRSSDGKMVKLKCPDCGRHNFGSAQGFINHCRIGHGRTFPSHDAAAEHCGEPVEYDATGAVLGVEPAPQPTTSSCASVHPLVRSAHLLPADPAPAPKLAVSTTDGATDSAHADSVSSEFRGASSTPFLSELVKNRGLGLDLQHAVTEAKTRVELPESDVEMSDEEEDVKPPVHSARGHPQIAGTRQIGAPSKVPATSPLLNSRLPALKGAMEDFGHPIEPSPTTESNQAPSLIDDDEEFEAGSPASTPSEMAEDDVHIRVRDDDDALQEDLTRSDFQTSCANPDSAVPSPVRRPSAFRRETEEHEEKHVSFEKASPMPEQISPDRSKRRKISK